MPRAPKTLLDKIIVDKALDRASRLRQQYIRNGMSPEKLQQLEGELIDNLDPIVKRWKPSMRRGWKGTTGIFDTGKFMNQFESNRSGGAFDKEKRRAISNLYFDDAVKNDEAREKYGFLKRPRKYGLDDVNWYGDYEFSFKPSVRKKMTFINGDSLNNFGYELSDWRVPTPVVPGMPETYINWTGMPTDYNPISRKLKPNEERLVEVVERLKKRPGPTLEGLDDADYVEAQYHGPLTLEDVEGLRSPFWGLEPRGSGIERLVKSQIRYNSKKYGFPVYDWNGKCIYNCR